MTVDFDQLARDLENMTPEEKAKLERFGLEVRVMGNATFRKFMERFDCELVDVKDLRKVN